MKTTTCLIIAIIAVFSSSFAEAQNKVVVVPLASTPEIQKHFYGMGQINDIGQIFYPVGKPFSVSHPQTGKYTITMPSLRPNCLGPQPLVFASMLNLGFVFCCNGGATNCTTGNYTCDCWTYSASGTLTNRSFNISIMLTD